MARKIDNRFIIASRKATFNPSEWRPEGDPISLEELWEMENPGLFESIEGPAEVTSTQFKDGSIAYRLTVPFKNGSTIDLKLSPKSELEIGDRVNCDTITATLLTKVGQDDIVRFDGEPLDE